MTGAQTRDLPGALRHGVAVAALALAVALAGGLWMLAGQEAARAEAQAVAAGTREALALARLLERDWTAALARVGRLHDLAGRITRAQRAGQADTAQALRAALDQEIARAADTVVQVAVMDTNATLLWRTPGHDPGAVPPAAAAPSAAEPLRAIAQGGPDDVVGRPAEGRVPGLIPFSRALRDAAGGLAGVSIVSLVPGPADVMARTLGLDPNDVLVVARDDGVVLARAGGFATGPDTALHRQALAEGQATRHGRDAVDGMARWFAARRVPGAPVVVTIGLDAAPRLQDAAAQAGRLRRTAALLGSGGVAATGLVLALLARQRAWSRERTTLAALRRSAALLRRLGRNLSELICLHAEDGRYLYVGSAAVPLLGTGPETLLGTQPGALTLAEDQLAVAQAWHRLQCDGTPQRLEVRIRRPDGGVRWVALELVRIGRLDPALADAAAFLSVTRDVTARHVAASAADLARRELQAVVSAVPGFLARSRILQGGGRQVGYVSPSIEGLLGYTPEQAKAPGFWEARMDPEVAERRRATIAAARDGTRFELTFQVRRADGEPVWLQETATVRLRPAGWREIVGFFTDVTARHEAEAALARARADLDDIVSNGPGVLFRRVYDGRGPWRTTYVSANVERVTGYTPGEFMRPGFLETVADFAPFGTAEQRLQRHLRQDLSDWEYGFRHASGAALWLRSTTRLNRLEDGRYETVGVLLDITAERRSADALAAARRDLEAIASLGPAILYRALYDATGERMVYVSDNAEQAVGYTAAELMQPAFAAGMIHPDDIRPIGAFLPLLRERGTMTHEKRYRDRDGNWRWLRRTLRVVADDGATIEALGVAMDITRERVAEAASDRARAELAAIVAAGPGALYRVRIGPDHRRHVHYMSEVFDRITGRLAEVRATETLLPEWFDPATFPPPDVRTAALAEHGAFTREVRFRHAAGHWIWLRDLAVVVATQADGSREVVGHLTDITAERATADAMAQTARMAVLGELAGGIAQALEHPLGIIGTAAAEALAAVAARGADAGPDPAMLRALLELVAGQAGRADRVIAHLRRFGQDDAGPAGPVVLADAVTAALLILGGRLRAEGVSVRHDLPPDLPRVLARLIPLQHALANLIANACDGIRDAGDVERVIRVSARASGGRVVLRVADRAGGIPEAMIGRMPDPFSVSSNIAGGGGPGLSISAGIIADLGGTLAVRNEDGGAVSEIDLAAAPAASSDGGGPARARETA